MSVALARVIGSMLSPSGARGRLAVFTYHQVFERIDPLRRGEPDRAEFLADVQTIGRVFNVLPLPEAVERLAAGTLPRRAACITFDDGYANNHEVAAPILERAGLPATIYIAGGAVDAGVMWNDLVIEAVRIKGSDWIVDDLEKLGDGLRGHDAPADFLDHTLKRLKYKPMKERWAIAEAFFRTNTGRELPRLMMDRAAVADLAQRRFDIGGHTIQHPILKELPDDEARREITGCHRWIEEVTGQGARSFAYPNGVPGRDFGPEHERMVKEAGFTSAVSTRWSVAGPGCDVYSIPRIGPWWRLGSSLVSGGLRGYAKSWLRQS